MAGLVLSMLSSRLHCRAYCTSSRSWRAARSGPRAPARRRGLLRPAMNASRPGQPESFPPPVMVVAQHRARVRPQRAEADLARRPAPACGPSAAPTRATRRCPVPRPAPMRPGAAGIARAAAPRSRSRRSGSRRGACPCHGPAAAANASGSGRPDLTHRWWWELHMPVVRAVRPHRRTRQAGPPNTGSRGIEHQDAAPELRPDGGQKPLQERRAGGRAARAGRHRRSGREGRSPAPPRTRRRRSGPGPRRAARGMQAGRPAAARPLPVVLQPQGLPPCGERVPCLPGRGRPE